MEKLMRETGMHLLTLESRRPIKDFDIVGFSLHYELTYTNVLNMLELAGISPLASERTESDPLIIAGGVCALNPEPMAEFFDAFVLGEGEEVTLELINTVREGKTHGRGKRSLLLELAKIPGIYVPSLYDVAYDADGTVASVRPNSPEAPPTLHRRILVELPPPPTRPPLPYVGVIHDRGRNRDTARVQPGLPLLPSGRRLPAPTPPSPAAGH